MVNASAIATTGALPGMGPYPIIIVERIHRSLPVHFAQHRVRSFLVAKGPTASSRGCCLVECPLARLKRLATLHGADKVSPQTPAAGIDPRDRQRRPR